MRIVILARPEARDAALTLARTQDTRDVRVLLIDDGIETPAYDRDGDVRIQQGIALRPVSWLHHLANRTARLNGNLSRWLEQRARSRSAMRMERAWKAELAFLRADRVFVVGEGLPGWASAMDHPADSTMAS